MAEPTVRSTCEALRCDWRANPKNPKARMILIGFRLSAFFARRRTSSPVLWLAGIPLMVSYRVFVEWVLGTELPAKTDVGPGLRLYHGQSLVVFDGATIGSDVVLRHSTTIGVAAEGSAAAPVIGDGVDVGSNAVILGGIVVGDGAVIGAGAVVVSDVPPFAVVAGNPARIIRFRSTCAGEA